MAKEYPALVRRAYDAGHTIGTHSMTHPIRFRALSVERGNAQIDNGIAATAAALGDRRQARAVLPLSGLRTYRGGRSEHAAERGLMVWGADVPADDWQKIGAARWRAARCSGSKPRAKASCCCTTSISEPSRRCRSSSPS